MNKIKFKEVVYKICPDCGFEIKPEYTSAYNDEWCPNCGLNHKLVVREGQSYGRS